MNQIRKQTHPNAVQLAAFALKRLGEADRAKVEKHLAECNTCRTFLAKTPGDDLARLLREHQATSLHQQSTPAMHDQSTMSGRRRQASNSQQSQLSSGGSPVKGASNAAETIPPELRQQKKYRVLRLLGRGGMGAVYEADHTMMRRKVAIKVISPSLISDPQALQRFELEVVAAAQLDHPNVARAYDADQFGCMRALIMEFVPGRSLDKLLASVGSLPIETACRCVRQALAGLQHAHEHGMVHRDLKPHNLMLTPDGKLKVLDFGLAKLTESQAVGEGLTSANAIMGTTHYMAPEQALDAKTADIRADIYSLGCTLFYLIAGRPPFEADTEMKILLAHQRDVPPPLNKLRDDVPDGLAKLIAWMLEKNPADRPQTPVESGRALAPYARGEFDTAGPEADTTQKEATELEAIAKLAEVSALPKTRIEKPQSSGRRRNYWISAGAGILVSSFFFAWLFGGFRANTPEGSIIIDKVPADVNVEVDGSTVTLTRNDETLTITAVEAGDHHLRFLRDGQEVWASDATLPIGQELVRVAYEPPVTSTDVNPTTKSTVEGPGLESKPEPAATPEAMSKFPFAQVNDDKWRIIGDELLRTTSTGDSELLFGDPRWTDYDLTMEARIEEGEKHGIIIIFARNSKNHGRNLSIGGLGLRVLQFDSWRGDWDPEVRESTHWDMESGKWHPIKLVVRSGKATCMVDGKILSSEDPELPAGRIGFRLIETAARFRNIEVKRPDGRVLWSGLPKLRDLVQDAEVPHVQEPESGPVVVSVGELVPSDVEARRAEIFGGSWTIEGNELVQLSTELEIKGIAFGNIAWGDLDFSVEVKFPDHPNPRVYVAFNGTTPTHYRALRLGLTSQDLYRINGDEVVPVETIQREVSPGWHEVRIKVRGGQCECLVDDKALFRPQFDGLYRVGRIGFGTSGTSGRFRNIKITDSSGELLWMGLPELPEKSDATAAEDSTDPLREDAQEAKGPKTFDLDRWHISQPSLLHAEEKGTTIQAGSTGNFFMSKTAYGDVNLDLELKAQEGTDAWLIFRGKKDGEKWTGITSRIYDNGEAISAGMQFHSYDFAEHGMHPEHAEYDVPFHLHANLKNEVMWLKVNDVTTSGVSYRRRWEETSGSIGLYVERGAVTIGRFDVNGSEAMRARVKRSNGTVSIAEPQESEDPEIIKLNEAKAAYEEGLAEARKAFIDRLKRSEELARTTPDKEEKRSQRLAFENQGTIPSGGISKEYERELSKQESLLQHQYSEARKSFKRNGQWSDAEEVLREWVGAPQDAESDRGRFYKLFTDVVTWQEAQDRCREQGGHLAIVTSPSQNNLIATHLSVAECSSAWLGANYQREERSWKWVDGVTSRYTNWQAGQPLTSNKDDQYLMMVVEQDKGMWVSQPNRASKYQPGFVCEWYRHLD